MTPLLFITLATVGITAIVGTFVAYQAYRGYRRNQSSQMRALAIGIVFIAVIPYVLVFGLLPLVNITDAESIIVVLLCQTVGLIAIYRSLDTA